MKTLQANPDLLNMIETYARANPMESLFIMAAVLLSVCYRFRGII